MIQNNLQLLKITSCASLPMIWRIWVQYSINTPITLKLVWLDYQMVLKLECHDFKCKMQRWSFGIFSMYPCSGSWGLVPISQIAQMPQILSSIYNSHLEWPLGLRKPNWMQEILSWRMWSIFFVSLVKIWDTGITAVLNYKNWDINISSYIFLVTNLPNTEVKNEDFRKSSHLLHFNVNWTFSLPTKSIILIRPAISQTS